MTTSISPTFRYVPGYGPSSAKLMIVGEAPGETEEKLGRPFVGPSGDIAAQIAQQAGFDWESTFRTNVFPWRPPGNDFKRLLDTGHTTEEGEKLLWGQIRELQPNCILALGAVAFHTLVEGKKNLNLCRGSIYLAKDGKTKVVATHHPARLLPSNEAGKMLPYSTRFIMRLDFKRALDESKNPTLELPQRLLQVARTSLDLHRYFEQYRESTIVSLDIESIKSVPVCLGLAFNSFHAISVPLIDIPNKISIPVHEKIEIFRQLDQLFRRKDLKIIGQNWKFDHDKLESCTRFRLPEPYFDIMLAHHCLYPELPKGLNFITSVATREPYYKDELKEFNLAKSDINDLYLYNAKDVAVPFEIYEKYLAELQRSDLLDYFFQYKMPLHQLYLEMERNGFEVDEEVRGNLRVKYDALELDYQCKLDLLAGFDVNVSSPKQMALLLYGPSSIAKLPTRHKRNGNITTDEEALIGLLGNHAKTDLQRNLITNILTLRQIRKTKSTYVNFRKDYDGRCRTNFQICGTETDRGATQLLDPPTRPHKIGLTFHNITSHSEIGADLKSMLKAPEGYIIGNADLSQAEPRIVAVLSEDWDLLEEFKTIDVHKKSAGLCFDIRPLDTAQLMSKEDPRRFVGKTIKNATNYKAGKKRAMVTVNTDAKKYGIDIQISEWKAGKMLEAIAAFYPKTSKVFHAGIERCLRETRTLFDPFGGRRLFMGKMDDELFKEGYAHIPQRTVITHLRQAMLRAKRTAPEIQYVNEHHDAVAWFSTPENFPRHAEIIREELQTPINFRLCSLSRDYDLVIPVDIEWGLNYGAWKETNQGGLRKWRGEKIEFEI